MAKMDWSFFYTLVLALFSMIGMSFACCCCKKKIPFLNRAMDKAFVQEVIVLIVTLLLSYLETCYACTRHQYVDCNENSPKCDKKST
ncbi:unnamed protein product [Euphydryas editha]|uniref:Uncharacterized protein n=1 Tax=Euphydryas editha TaxID=104508 RepID=A0AAU9UIM5_EUPED|nr:unnamed protein product [Euphydryas editha]